ncbi:MAG TPA: ATP-binding protein [Puia sp.]|nr:ATP-binding protein [Puia sp.]
MQKVSPSWLQSIESLKEVPEDQLQWLIDNSEQYELGEGAFLFKEDEPIRGTYIILSGRLRIFWMQVNEMRELLQIGPKFITGYLPFSRGVVAGASCQVLENASILTFPVARSRELITGHFELTQALVHIMTTRVREVTSMQQQDEKMMALGKLSAGLAHELNNPAAAIVRGSTTLLKHLKLEPTAFKEVMAIRMEEKEVDLVTEKLFEILGRKEKPKLTLMERTEREDELRDWLEDHLVDNSEEVAENFLDYGFTCDDLGAFTAHIPPAYLSPVFNWINSNLVTERMVQDIQESSQRISELVTSVKNFTHMDQGTGKEYTDIRTGIGNTLKMLNYKLKKGNIEVIEDYDGNLPKVKALVGELNQVWTNLIDNAIDAMGENKKGKLTIKTERDKEFAKVSIGDDGPGIPPEILSHIFEPFFTTKEIGKGTGLGLDVVSRIVRQHRGSVKVDSHAGLTVFVVCFPIDG